MAYYSDPWLTVYAGDCRAVLAELPAESVHCVVTSPPYWGLRDYGTASWDGGAEGCDHAFKPDAGKTTIRTTQTYQQGHPFRDCKCGATRIDNQLGLEPTPEQYVANLVAVFREVRRVLRRDGTLWLNLGDSYAAGKTGRDDSGGNGRFGGPRIEPTQRKAPAGLKPKDLVGIPWRVAFALQADGWYLRSDIIWSKPNPMPESVTDRPTKSHEYLFLLAKSERYYFDADAVREELSPTASYGGTYRTKPSIDNPSVLGRKTEPHSGIAKLGKTITPNPAGRNIRSVWTVATAPYAGAHFATFPPKLIEPCIKAGTSERGVCAECGAPWRRVVERVRGPVAEIFSPKNEAKLAMGLHSTKTGLAQPGWRKHPVASSASLGWQPSCAHAGEPVPATLLDPFAGSGTTGKVAQSLSRRAILIDLNPAYLMQALERNRDIPLGLGAA